MNEQPQMNGAPEVDAPDEADYAHGGVLGVLREWGDALIIAFVLAMFVRVFIVELFKIPSGSMTPTLVGDYAMEADLDEDGYDDLIVLGQETGTPKVFMNHITHYEPSDEETTALRRRGDIQQWREQGVFTLRYDRILVNKFAYWRSLPNRGDVIVFKVPEVIWDPTKPIYIKRCAGLPGESLQIDGPLRVGGRMVNNPPFYRHQIYENEVPVRPDAYEPLAKWVEYRGDGWSKVTIDKVRVPEDSLYVLGDNTTSSADSRFWGFVPTENLKGKAFMRYWPFSKIKFIE